jgi:adenylate cyclase
MSDEGYRRKLTAVFSADVAGYSRLMGENEAATVKTLETYKQIMFSLIEQHRGRVVDSPGDNLLAEFASVVDAVQCGVAVQNELKARNADLPENRRMQFRIGINLGDVIEEEGRIYGSGVNIAARIEGLASPGAICISGGAYDQIKDKLNFGYGDLGSHKVKNIKEPVRVYRVLMDPKSAGKLIVTKTNRSKLKWGLAVAASFFLIIFTTAAGLYSKYIYLPNPKNIDLENKLTLDLPKGPSIAVLPFLNMTGDPHQEIFCDGITESIISGLAYIRNLPLTLTRFDPPLLA